MYEIIARELKSEKLEDAHPCDYLNFYCLGNREECHEESSSFQPSGSSSSSSDVVMILHYKRIFG